MRTLLLLTLASTSAFAQDVWVDEYTRSDGTHVTGHYRTAPDNTIDNNYSTYGNTNPYTGVEGTVISNSYYNNKGSINLPLNPPDVGLPNRYDSKGIADMEVPVKKIEVGNNSNLNLSQSLPDDYAPAKTYFNEEPKYNTVNSSLSSNSPIEHNEHRSKKSENFFIYIIGVFGVFLFIAKQKR